MTLFSYELSYVEQKLLSSWLVLVCRFDFDTKKFMPCLIFVCVAVDEANEV